MDLGNIPDHAKDAGALSGVGVLLYALVKKMLRKDRSEKTADENYVNTIVRLKEEVDRLGKELRELSGVVVELRTALNKQNTELISLLERNYQLEQRVQCSRVDDCPALKRATR